jgi:hypothetical protein
MPSQKYFLNTSFAMLLLVRVVTGFQPLSQAIQRPVAKTTTTSLTFKRNVHYYNSLWLNRRHQLPSVNALRAEEDDNQQKASSSSSTTHTDDDDVWAKFRNPKNRDDQVISAISKQGGIKVTACTIRNIVNDIMMQHTMTEVASSAIGRTMICALLMSNGIQAEQTVQITLNCKYIMYYMTLL